MKLEIRLMISYLVRLVFIFFGGWVALAPEALPQAHLVTRIGLAALFLVFSLIVGEVSRLQTQFEMLMRALRAATGKAGGTAAPETEREAVGILIRALESREPATREKAHRNLVRLTGQDLPPEREAWEAWWKEHKKTWGREG